MQLECKLKTEYQSLSYDHNANAARSISVEIWFNMPKYIKTNGIDKWRKTAKIGTPENELISAIAREIWGILENMCYNFITRLQWEKTCFFK